MDRLISKFGKVAILLAPLFLILPFALAEDAKYVGEDYYGNDINAAVLEADQNKRQLNYNRQHWYNRTTSKSFELAPLAGSELDTERLEGALGATASGGEAIAASPEMPSTKQSEQIQKDFLQESANQGEPTAIDPNPNLLSPVISGTPSLSTSHTFPRGDMVITSGVLSTGTVTSTPRP